MIGRHRGQVCSHRYWGWVLDWRHHIKLFWGVGLVVMAVCQVIFLLVDRLLSLASQLLQGAVGGMDCVDGQEADVGLVLAPTPVWWV